MNDAEKWQMGGVKSYEVKQPTASSGSAFEAEKKAIEFQEDFYPEVGEMTASAIRFSFAQGYRIAQKQNERNNHE